MEDVAHQSSEAVVVKGKNLWILMWLRFKRNRLGMAGLFVLVLLYLAIVFCEVLSPYTLQDTHAGFEDHPPTPIKFWDHQGKFHVRPFVYGYKRQVDLSTFKVSWKLHRDKQYPLYFFTRQGSPYPILGVLPWQSNFRMFSVREGHVFLFGTDKWGRDMFSRVLYGGRISLTIGWVGVSISTILGILIGLVSGLFGGFVDFLSQRVIEVLMSVPTLPLWMVLSAALPKEWSPIQVYFGIVVILSLFSWMGLARMVRGMILAYRDDQHVLAARNLGAGTFRIMFVHLLPLITSYILVSVTLAIPGMIIAETGLSFLGLGIRPPMTSWGALLSEAQSVHNVVNNMWYLIPSLFVIFAVLAFNFVGDGLRDAADPFSSRR